MSNRIWVSKNDTGPKHQLFGNHDFPKPLHSWLVKKGVPIDQDGCFESHTIEDINGFLYAVLDSQNSEVADDTYWDFKPKPHQSHDTPYRMWAHCTLAVENRYVMVVYNLIEYLMGAIDYEYKDNKETYYIKDDVKIQIARS